MDLESDRNLSPLQKAIIQTVAYFDLFNFPLTLLELYDKLWLPGYSNQGGEKISLLKIKEEVEAERICQIVESKNGFYFLKGREELLEERRKGYNIANRKYGIALRTAGYLKYIKGVKMIAVCNTLASGHIKEESDIDFFIVTAKNRIWLTRLLVTIVVQLLGVRRYKDKVKDRICLSFYITEDRLNLKEVTYDFDPHFYYWLSAFSLLYDDGIFKRFSAENGWLKKYMPFLALRETHEQHRVRDNCFSCYFKKINGLWQGSFIGNIFERVARRMQLKKMSRNKFSVAGMNDKRVIISDKMLKFHEKDRRVEYRERWLEKLKEISTDF